MENLKHECVQNIGLDKLRPFPDHPFIVRDDEQMQMLTESIRTVGVLVPVIARPLSDGTYELIAGHRRKRACERVGIPTLPVIVRKADLDTATVMMVDSNFQREEILPSERAKAYKMKLEAIKRQGARTDSTSDQVGQKLNRKSSRDLIAENSPDSSSQIQRYLRLNELIPELLQMVDAKKIALTPAAELSFLTKDEQQLLLVTIESEQATPSLSQSQRMKRISQEGTLTDDTILEIMMEQKKPECWNLTLPMNKITKYFPQSYERLLEASEKLKNVEIKCQDFDASRDAIKQSDLVFLDPPYTVSKDANSMFIKYNSKLFSLDDQYRLASLVDHIIEQGAFFILTNAAHEKILEIFNGKGRLITQERNSLIGGKKAFRGKVQEYIFTNIPKKGIDDEN